MTDQTPAQELRTAAEKLRQAAAAADETNPAPWTAVKPTSTPGSIRAFVFDAASGRIASGSSMGGRAGAPWLSESTAAYLILVHPGLGAALSDWLDREARAHEATVEAAARVFHDDPASRDAWVTEQANGEALAVARAILGGTS